MSSADTRPVRQVPSFQQMLLQLCLFSLWLGSAVAQEAKPTGIDLTKATLNQTVAALSPDAYVLMEFYATWCPACRAFKPDYDKVARFLQSQPNGPSKVHAFRLDCATNQDVCGTYKVQAYPSMYAGRAEDLLAVNLAQLGRFDYGKYSRNAVGVVQFVADHFKINDLLFVDVPEPAPTQAVAGSSKWVASDIQWTEQDVQLATNELVAQITASKALHSSPEQREALVDLLTLFQQHHPSDSCQAGATESLAQLNKLWPAGQPEPVSDLKSLSVCGDCAGHDSCSGGTDAAASLLLTPGTSSAHSSTSTAAAAPPPYVACKGSKADSRGYTCGLWLLFHAIAARLPEADGGVQYMKAMKGFGHQFFQCAVCKKHFERCVDSPEAAAVRSRRDAVLWTWKVHNEVNQRLEMIEAKYGHSSTGDPEFPKVQWPVAEACPECRLLVQKKRSDERGGGDGGRKTGEAAGSTPETLQWSEEQVYQYLLRWYGGKPGDGNKITFKQMPESGLQQQQMQQQQQHDGLAGHGTAPPGLSMKWLLVLAAGVCVMLYVAYGRAFVQKRRPFLKGPGAVFSKLHQHGKGHGMTPSAGGGGSAATGAQSNGIDWPSGARHGARKL